jgi:hypothetical protein
MEGLFACAIPAFFITFFILKWNGLGEFLVYWGISTIAIFVAVSIVPSGCVPSGDSEYELR